ncbi:Aspartate/methionine/tyrosine aminotransferase (AspB) [Fructobacillus cardui]|uniref:aminotransferase class I/II-fold pyridoxal phosphate-dependent enzyme n=1 Tax=Fructobacillus cardui TaxID=2893170 RepID=UPI002D9EA066|nr:Aspartate/methionine/tyrosine aminotransferase (AspB) [Fructobacillus cardui]
MNQNSIIRDAILSVPPEGISTFSKQIEDIPGIIKLTVGEPDFDTPDHIKSAGIWAIQENDTHYTDPLGTLAVRQAAADFVAKKYGIFYDAKTEVVTTIGVSEAILDVFLALLEPGDEVFLPSPVFPVYQGAISIAGGKVDYINLANDNFKLTPERLRQEAQENPRAKTILLTTPSNPTGVSYEDDELEALAAVAREFDLTVISDEIYAEITYDKVHSSIAKFIPERTIVFNGLSKSHAMTGWRFGVIFAPESLMEGIAKVHVFNSYDVSSIVQKAAIEAFTVGINDIDPMKKVYKERRDLVLAALEKVGIEAVTPEGAFYIFAKIPANYESSLEFCTALAEQARVGVVPGDAFGPGGEGYFRISYATSTANLEMAMDRLTDFLVADDLALKSQEA